MRRDEEWEAMYKSGDLPCDTGRSDFNLREIIYKNRIRPCNALEIGCGTGSNAIWLARKGFSMTAVDISEAAIGLAAKRASRARVKCAFFTADFMKEKIFGGPFGFIFDRGCFHSFDLAAERKRYAEKVGSYLKKDGLWFTLVGSCDEPPREPGPPQRSANDITSAAEPYFEILQLYASHFDSNMKRPPKAWVCLMRKRDPTK